jgi:itaconate CoA-transferase
MKLPLDGVLVVSLEQAVAAPFATRQLADLGARVIKIERPDGGDFARAYDATVNGLSSYFVWLNRSKESLTLDVKRADGQAILAQLIDRADVFVQNVGPGAAARLGTSATVLRAARPRLVVCTISGYGASGPYAGRKAYDLLVQNEVGLVSVTGTNETPSRVGISVADIAAGMYGFSGILTALLARTDTGAGAAVDVSLFDALAEWMGAPAYYTAYSGAPPPRTGGAHATIAPYEVFVTRDGTEICLAIQNHREWTRFCTDVIGRPDLSDDARFRSNPERVRHRETLHQTIAAVVGGLDAAALLARLQAAGIASARRNDVAAFLAHPQLAARDRWRDVGSPSGPVRALLPPIEIDGREPVMGAIPALGQHTEAILQELGFDGERIAQFRAEGTI